MRKGDLVKLSHFLGGHRAEKKNNFISAKGYTTLTLCYCVWRLRKLVGTRGIVETVTDLQLGIAFHFNSYLSCLILPGKSHLTFLEFHYNTMWSFYEMKSGCNSVSFFKNFSYEKLGMD